MAKLTTTDLTSLSNETSAVNTINNNNAAIETAMEQAVFRDGTADNEMNADFDMNGNDILNVGAVTFASGSAGVVGLQGPAASTDNALARWNGTNGSTLDSSGWTLSDGDVLTAGGGLNMGANSITNVASITMTGGGTLDTNGGAVTLGGGNLDTEGGDIDIGCADLIDIGDATFCATGSLDMNWAPTKAHCELADSESSSSNAITLDLENGNYFYTTLTENITTVTFTEGTTAGEFTSWSWEITQDAGASGYTITWPAAVKWAGGTDPTLSTGASAVDILTFWTRDAGTTIYGSVVGQDFS